MGGYHPIPETRVKRALAKALAESVLLHETFEEIVNSPPESWASQLATALAPAVARELNDHDEG